MLSLLIRQAVREVKPVICLIPRRTFLIKKKTNEKTYRLKDNIDESFSIIYKAPMEFYLKACNYITTISAVVFGSFVIYKFRHFGEEVSTERREMGYTHGAVTMSDDEYLYFAIALVGFCASIRMILYKYPLRIYRNQGNYIAVFEGQLPLSNSKITFEKGAVKAIPPKGILPWKENRFRINNRSTIMYFEYFKTPSELLMMMQAPKKAK